MLPNEYLQLEVDDGGCVNDYRMGVVDGYP